MSEMSFNPMRFIADTAGLNIFEVIDKAYQQGRADERERIVRELKEEREEILNSDDYENEIVNWFLYKYDIAIEIARGGENE